MSAIVLTAVVAVVIVIYEKLKPTDTSSSDPFLPLQAPPINKSHAASGNPPSVFNPTSLTPAQHPLTPLKKAPTPPPSFPPSSSPPPSSGPAPPPPVPVVPSAAQRYGAVLPAFDGNWGKPVPLAPGADFQSDFVHMTGTWNGSQWINVQLYQTPVQVIQCNYWSASGVKVCDPQRVPAP